MKQGSRYTPLYEHLRLSGQDEIKLSFAALEALLGGKLPESARAARAWWSNRETGLQAAAWLHAGYRVAEIDMAGQQVRFQRRKPVARLPRSDKPVWDSGSIRALREHMGLTQSQLADLLAMRQQTISEWETGAYSPTRASAKALTHVAEDAGFFHDHTEETQR